MTQETQPTQESATSRTTEAQLEAILAQLTIDQIRFLIARAETESDAEACRDIGLSRSTMAHWPPEVRELLRQARVQMAQDGLVTALHIRRRNVAKAMAVKVKGLDSGDERLRQSVATELIEWQMGRAIQPTEVSGKGGGPVVIAIGGIDPDVDI